MEQGYVEIRPPSQDTDRCEPLGNPTSKSSIMREDVAVHEPFKK
jgi:hypothetical protein